MTGHETRSASGEPGAGATHRRPVPADVETDASPDEPGSEGDAVGDGAPEPRGSDDDRPIDVAPRTGPFRMGPAEAGMDGGSGSEEESSAD